MVYTYQNLYDNVNGMIHKKIGNLSSSLNTLNRAARFVTGDIDLRSCKRKATASPNLFSDIFDYSCPSDLKGMALVDISPQVNRSQDSELRLTSPEEFDRLKTIDKLMVAFAQFSGTRKLRISMEIDDDELVISELDTTTSGGGTWAGFGDGENLTSDSDNYVNGNASINWDIGSGGGTTAGIVNTGLDAFDITDYLNAGSVFTWVYIQDITNITNFILRLGQSASAYYYKTVTTTNEGTAFVNGWNLLRFDLQSLSSTGSPSDEDVIYAAVYMTKDGAKINETDYRFDWMVMKRGRVHEVWYYSKYAWQSSAGTWIENSTTTTDYLNAETEELELITFKAAEYASQELKDYDDVKYFANEYKNKKADYLMKYPSEAKLHTIIYYTVQ